MARPYVVNFTVEDGEGKKSTGTFYIDSAQTIANAQTEAEGFIGDIAPMVSGAITSADLSIPLDVGTPPTPNAQSNIRYKFRAILKSALDYVAVLTIPAANQSLVVDGSNVVDSTDVDVAAFLAAVITRPIVTSHDEPITTISKFYEVFGK